MNKKKQNKTEYSTDGNYPIIGNWDPIKPFEDHFRFKNYKEFCADLSEAIGRKYRLNDSQMNKIFELLQSLDIKLGHRPSFLGHAPKSKAKIKKVNINFLESLVRDLDLVDYATNNDFAIFDGASEVIKVLIAEAKQGKLKLNRIDDFIQTAYGTADNINVRSANSNGLQFDSAKLDYFTYCVYVLLESLLTHRSPQYIRRLTSDVTNATVKNKYSYHFNLSAKNVSDMIIRHEGRESKLRKRRSFSTSGIQQNNISKTEILLTPGQS